MDDAVALAAAIRSGEVSPAELRDAAFRRLEAVEPELNAFVTQWHDEPLDSLPDGPFTGVPIAIKDLTDTRGIRTTYSCGAFAENVPARDAAVVRRIREAGFVIVGKTNTPEFGSTAVTESALNGVCRNPWNLERTPGGSSGGAAAHVAAGVLPLAHGSDGGGSIRIPASCCGLFGLKPSRGRVSGAPHGDGGLSLGQNGPLSRTVRDAAAFLDVIAGYEAGDAVRLPPPARPFADEVGAAPGRLRIAFTVEPPLPYPVESPCASATVAAAELLSELGHDVYEATPSWADDDLLDRFGYLWRVGPPLYGVPAEHLEPLNRALAEAAQATTALEYVHAVLSLQAYARRVMAFWDDADVMLTPTLAKLPVPIGWVSESDDPWDHYRRAAEFTPFTAVANLTGQPAASVPFATADGLPVGIQLLGRAGDEATLLRLAAQIEEARPWIDQTPPLFASSAGV
ncbi:MAG TPA: amidase [Gaiellaceae bacterium]|nr:amidase [Gaiellaceae bacterium]